MRLRPDLPWRLRCLRLDRCIFTFAFVLGGVANTDAAPPQTLPNSRVATEHASGEVMTWRPMSKSSNKVQPVAPENRSRSLPSAAGSSQRTANVEPIDYEINEGIEFGNEPGWINPPSSIEVDGADGCNADACDTWHDVQRPGRLTWVRAEYLLWMIDGADLPPLVTSSPTGTPEAGIGILGGNSIVLFGNDETGQDARSGGRLTIGSWFDRDRTVGWEASYTGFESKGESFHASSATQPNLARPYFDLTTSAEAGFLIAAEGTLSGSVDVVTKTQFQFAEVLRRQCLSSTASSRTDWLLGYRYGQFDDRLQIDQTSTFLVPQGPVIAGTTKSLFDRFETDTQFHGGVFGVDHQRRSGPWTVSTLAKMSLGGNRTEVAIDGETLTTVPGGGSAPFLGGLLAQESNIGVYSRSEFAVIPEFGVHLTGKLNSNVQFLVGYNLMYWTSVARAADQIDRSISQLPPEPITGSANPRNEFEAGGLFLHGLNTGLQIQF